MSPATISIAAWLAAVGAVAAHTFEVVSVCS